MRDVKIIDIDGLKLLYEYNNLNNEFCFAPCFKTGAITETDANCGITHFLEHMFAKQTKNYSEKQMLKYLQLYLPKYNAFTGFESMKLMCNTSNRYLNKMFKLFGEIVQNAIFVDERAKKESNVIVQEICRYEALNESVADDNLLRIMFKYPFAQNQILGTKENVLKTTGADLKARYDELVTKQNMYLSYSGSASEKQITDLVKKYFNNIPSNPQGALSRVDVKINGKEEVHIHKKEDNTISATMALKSSYNPKDKKQRYLSALLSRYLNNQGHPMWNEMREKQALVYGYWAGLRTLSNASFLNFDFQTTAKNIKKCIKSFAKIINNLYQKGLTKKYFEEIKEAYRIVLDGQIDTPKNCCFYNAAAYLKGYDFDDMKDILAMLDELTVEDFNAFVKDVFKSDFVCISLVGNIKEKDVQTLEELRTLFYK